MSDGAAADTHSRILTAEKLPDVLEGQYVRRSLRVPAVNAFFVWLKDEKGGKDIFMPISLPDKRLAAKLDYSVKTLTDAVSGLGKQQFDDRPALAHEAGSS